MKRIIVALLCSITPLVACVPTSPTAWGWTPDKVETYIRWRWAGTGQEDRAVRIAKCESGLNPLAANSRSSASGIFQIMAIHWRGKFDPFNPVENINYAFLLWHTSGWSAWVCRG